MNPLSYLYIGVLCFLSGAVVSPVLPWKARSYTYFLSLFGSLSFAVSGVYLSYGGPLELFSLPAASIVDFSFRSDSLSGFFVLVVSILAGAVSIYSVGY